MMLDTDKDAEDWIPVAPPIPEQWVYVPFEEAFDVISIADKKIPQKQYRTEGRYPIIDQGQAFIGGFTDSVRNVVTDERSLIVFGDHTKCFKLVSFPFAPGADGVKVLRPRPILDEKFAFYACLSLRLPDRGYSRHYGFLRRSSFPIAPIEEQRRIVAKAEALFSELDSGVKSLESAVEQLKVYRQSVLRDAFEGKLTALWRAGQSIDHWTKTTIGEQLTYLTSGSRGWAKYYATQGDTFIRAQNLKYDRLDLDDIAFVALPAKSEGMRTRVQKGDLLITITGANVTKTAVVKADLGTAYVSQHVALARPIEQVNPEFLYWFLIAEAAGRKQLNAAAYGAGKPGLNLDNIRSVEIRLPSLDEQTEIVSRINSLLSIADNVSSQLAAELGKARALRQLILKRAFSGRLKMQDPDDESVSALLGRIRTEQADSSERKSTESKEAA